MFTCHSYPTTPLGLDPFTSWLRKLMSYLIGLLSLLGLIRVELTMLVSTIIPAVHMYDFHISSAINYYLEQTK